ncbi:MAG: spore germination protein [Firmicutes bacterium]|nr:spore germination protein [Bacillota bacterium]
MQTPEEILATFATPDMVVRRNFTAAEKKGSLLFAPDMVDAKAIGQILFALEGRNDEIQNAESLIRRVIYTAEAAAETNIEAVIAGIVAGDCAIWIEGLDEIVLANVRMREKRGVAEPQNEAVVRGPRDGFTEDFKTNLSLLQTRLKSAQLGIKKLKIGRNSNTNAAVVFLANVASPKVVDEVMRRLQSIDIDAVYDSYNLETFLEYRPRSIFKQVGYTERPDSAAAKISEGRVAVVVEGSPVVLTVPFLLVEDFHSAEDYYQRPAYSTFLRYLRLLALVAAILLPGLYVTLLEFNYDLSPLRFLVAIMNATKGTPWPPLAEMLIVLLLFEIIRESAIRMPRIVGMAMSIVGAIVLSETIVRAGIISSPSILIIAVSSIALFTVPNHIGSFTLLRLLFTLAGGVFGLYGLLIGSVFLVHYLAGMDSYGTPYLAPFAPLIKQDLGDSLNKRPLFEAKKRPKSIRNINATRQS